VPRTTSHACSVATRYLEALARQDWDGVAASLAPDVVRHGPFGDDFEGSTPYLSFLRRTMPALPGYRMEIDRVTGLDDQRAMVELRETVVLETGPLVTHECLVFAVGADDLLQEISVYIRQASEGR
jgi:hypothetical protein